MHERRKWHDGCHVSCVGQGGRTARRWTGVELLVVSHGNEQEGAQGADHGAGVGSMNKDPVIFTPALLDFIRRRSAPFIQTHKSLETIVACAYVQGMNDALDALGKLK